MSDMEKAVEGGAEFIAAQQAHVAEAAAAEEARVAALPPESYPRAFDAHTRMVDSTNDHEFIGTQWSYNTEAEALAAIDGARAANKYVMYADPDKGSYVLKMQDGDYRVNIED